MLAKVGLMDLVGIAGMVGVVGAGLSLFCVNRTRDNVKKEDYYINAFKLLNQNRSAIDLIGGPIQRYRIDLSDSHNNCFESLSTRFKVPIKGRKKSGDLYVWADRQDSEKEWVVRRLEIIFNDIKDQKVIVYKNEPKK